jgi:outer membrane protein assembly factor BamB
VIHPSGWVAVETSASLDDIVWKDSGHLVGAAAGFVSCWTWNGQLVWTTPIEGGSWSGKQLLVLPDEDVVVADFARIHDDGVRIWRLDGATGKVVWQTHCAAYSESFWKVKRSVYVELIDDRLVVVDQVGNGGYVEVLEPATGSQVCRWPVQGSYSTLPPWMKKEE